MPAPYSPPWGRGSSGRRSSQADPNMRVSHAERTEVADRLSKHYGDGRLDEEEFNERLDRAMNAKTRADLDGLLADLPPGAQEQPEPPVVREPRRHPLARIAFLVLVVLVAMTAGQAVAHSFLWSPFGGIGLWPFAWHIPWLLIAVAVFLWWRFAHRRRL